MAWFGQRELVDRGERTSWQNPSLQSAVAGTKRASEPSVQPGGSVDGDFLPGPSGAGMSALPEAVDVVFSLPPLTAMPAAPLAPIDPLAPPQRLSVMTMPLPVPIETFFLPLPSGDPSFVPRDLNGTVISPLVPGDEGLLSPTINGTIVSPLPTEDASLLPKTLNDMSFAPPQEAAHRCARTAGWEEGGREPPRTMAVRSNNAHDVWSRAVRLMKPPETSGSTLILVHPEARRR